MKTSKQTEPNNRSRRTIVGLFLVFTAPMLLAYSGWIFGWFDNISRSNYGELLQPVITLDKSKLIYQNQPLNIENLNEHWWLIYVTEDKNCELACQANTYLINQSRTAQAKEMKRIEKFVVIRKGDFTEASKKYLNDHFGRSTFLRSENDSALKSNNIYIMDPHGNIMLRYDAVKDEKEAIKAGKGIIKDLKKLLKISQIG